MKKWALWVMMALLVLCGFLCSSSSAASAPKDYSETVQAGIQTAVKLFETNRVLGGIDTLLEMFLGESTPTPSAQQPVAAKKSKRDSFGYELIFRNETSLTTNLVFFTAQLLVKSRVEYPKHQRVFIDALSSLENFYAKKERDLNDAAIGKDLDPLDRAIQLRKIESAQKNAQYYSKLHGVLDRIYSGNATVMDGLKWAGAWLFVKFVTVARAVLGKKSLDVNILGEKFGSKAVETVTGAIKSK